MAGRVVVREPAVVPGDVVRLLHAFGRDTRPRWKMFVVAAVDRATVLALTINSSVSRYVRARPHLRDCQAPIDVREHPFLQRDSFVDCATVQRLPTAVVLSAVENEPSLALGEVSDAARVAILDHAQRSIAIAGADMRAMLVGLDPIPF